MVQGMTIDRKVVGFLSTLQQVKNILRITYDTRNSNGKYIYIYIFFNN